MTELSQPGGLFVPRHVVENREAPRAFVKQLQTILGRDLHVTWHVGKQRFVIEQCIEHCGLRTEDDGLVLHTHLCRRIYVWLVRDEETGESIPLGDRVIAKLQEIETYRKYGTGPEALQRFRAESAAFDREQAKKTKEDAHSTFEYLKRHNRIVRNKLKMWMGRHDWLRPHK